ncbi:MAG: hypothetical protein ACI3Y5_09155 [Prevotella sp.]
MSVTYHKNHYKPLEEHVGAEPYTTFFQKAIILFKAININGCAAIDVYRLVVDAKPERVMVWLDENI